MKSSTSFWRRQAETGNKNAETYRKREKEHDELAEPSYLSSSIAQNNLRRRLSAGQCRRPAPPRNSRKSAPSRGQGRGTQGGFRRGAAGPGSTGASSGELHSKSASSDSLIMKGNTETRRRRQSQRRASFQLKQLFRSFIPHCCRGRTACHLPRRTAAQGFSRFAGDFQSAAKARPTGDGTGAKSPPFQLCHPCASSSSPQPRTARPFAPVAQSCAPAVQTSLLDCSSLTTQELLQFRSLPPNRFTRIGLSRRSWLRFPAPARGGRRQRPPPTGTAAGGGLLRPRRAP